MDKTRLELFGELVGFILGTFLAALPILLVAWLLTRRLHLAFHYRMVFCWIWSVLMLVLAGYWIFTWRAG